MTSLPKNASIFELGSLGLALVGGTRLATDTLLSGGLPDQFRCFSREHFAVRCPTCGVSSTTKNIVTGDISGVLEEPFALLMITVLAAGSLLFFLRLAKPNIKPNARIVPSLFTVFCFSLLGNFLTNV